MSASGAFIGFGFAFAAGTKFPWDAEPFQRDIEFWWRSVNGFKDLHEPLSVPSNDRKDWDGRDPKIVDEVFEHRRQFHEINPIPIELKPFGDLDCHDDDAQFAIVVPGIGCDCLDEDDPELFDPSAEKFILHVGNLHPFYEFLERYGIQPKDKPSWMVCCYY